jgi:hypothetical protein
MRNRNSTGAMLAVALANSYCVVNESFKLFQGELELKICV